MRKNGKNAGSILKIVFIICLFVFIANNPPLRGNQSNIQSIINDSSQIGSDWVEMSPEIAPPARYHHFRQSAYDSQSDRIILFSGDNGDYSKMYNDTWAYDYNSNTWENLTTPEMKNAAKLAAAMAYDSESDRIIMFGGWKWAHGHSVYQETGVGETWSYDYETNTWTNLTTENSPPFRGCCSLTYDKANDRMIMFGGFDSKMNEVTTLPFYHDTWAYDYNTNTWTNMTPTVSPPPLGNPGTTYDSKSNKTILFGGVSCRDCVDLDETWVYDYKENTWTNLNPVIHPTKRVLGMMTYNSKLDRIIFFGGLQYNGGIYHSDTWMYNYNTNTWTDMNSPAPPDRRYSHSFDYDSESDVSIIFGGRVKDNNGVSYVVADTWAYHYQANIPSSPRNLKATLINETVRLSWNCSETDAGSPITEYVIYRGNKSDSLTLYSIVLGAEVTHFQDTEVSRGATYYYAIRAKNAVGESKDSNVVSITIPSSPGVPGFSLVLTSAIIIYLVVLRKRSNQ
ncbi:MAG: kelch repeat-containing protein [Candidatus Thorarchaeota archaeon]